MRVLKQVLSVQLNEKLRLGAWEGGAEYDGSNGTISLTLAGIVPDRAVQVLQAIEAAVGAVVRQDIAMEIDVASVVAKVAAVAVDKPPTQINVCVGDEERAAPPAISPVQEVDMPARAPELSTPPSERHAPRAIEVAVEADVAAMIDKAARAHHSAKGSIGLLDFVKLCGEHDAKCDAEIDASAAENASVISIKKHVDRNVQFFASYSGADDAKRTTRLLNTARGLLAAKPPAS